MPGREGASNYDSVIMALSPQHGSAPLLLVRNISRLRLLQYSIPPSKAKLTSPSPRPVFRCWQCKRLYTSIPLTSPLAQTSKHDLAPERKPKNYGQWLYRGTRPTPTTDPLVLSLRRFLGAQRKQDAWDTYEMLSAAGKATHLNLHDFRRVLELIRFRRHRRDTLSRLDRLLADSRAANIRWSHADYETMLTIYARFGEALRAKALIARIREESEGRVQPQIAAFNRVMSAFARSGDISGVKDVLREVEASGLRPDLVSFNTLLAAQARENDFKGAKETLAWIERQGFRPDVVTFNILMGAHLRANDLERAQWYLDEMQKAGIKPSTRTLHQLMDALGMAGQVDAVERLSHWTTCAIGANILLRTYAQHGYVQRAQQLFEHLPRRTRPAYNTMIGMYLSEGMVPEAVQLCERMVATGIEPDVVTYGLLINRQVDAGRLVEADRCISAMRARGLEPSAPIYNMLLKGELRTARAERSATNILQKMEHDGIVPTPATFHTLLANLDAEKAPSDGGLRTASGVIKILEGMVRAGWKPSTWTFNAVLDGIVKEELQWLRWRRKHPQRPLQSSREEPKGKEQLEERRPRRFGEGGSVVKMVDALLDKMQTLDTQDDMVAYTVLLRRALLYCTSEEDVIPGDHLVSEMLSTGIRPNVHTLTTLLAPCAELKLAKRADAIWHGMLEAGVQPNVVAYTAMAVVWLRCGEVAHAKNIMDRMAAQGIPPDFIASTVLDEIKKRGGEET
ncbi:uncharacterized protein VTP21DRAFT_2319 [Calcarisporiella thermophila]|uniref:uncharacterized protein n=1 Tax=Calcarisporiella thermophila TaxID=911321 RepID=UPI0037440CD4